MLSEIQIYTNFIDSFQIDIGSRKEFCGDILFKIIQEALNNDKFKKITNNLLNNSILDKKIIQEQQIKKLKELYNNSLYSDKKNHFKTFIKDIPRTKEILENKLIDIIPSTYFNKTLKHVRYQNKYLIKKTILKLVKLHNQKYENIQQLIVFNKNEEDVKSIEKIEQLDKYISELKLKLDRKNIKELNLIETLKRENKQLHELCRKNKDKLDEFDEICSLNRLLIKENLKLKNYNIDILKKKTS